MDAPKTSDSEETFLYDSFPTEAYSSWPSRINMRSPSLTTVNSQTDQSGNVLPDIIRTSSLPHSSLPAIAPRPLIQNMRSNMLSEYISSGPKPGLPMGLESPPFLFAINSQRNEQDDFASGSSLKNDLHPGDASRGSGGYSGGGAYSEGGGNQKCYSCGKIGHVARNCTEAYYSGTAKDETQTTSLPDPRDTKRRYRLDSQEGVRSDLSDSPIITSSARSDSPLNDSSLLRILYLWMLVGLEALYKVISKVKPTISKLCNQIVRPRLMAGSHRFEWTCVSSILRSKLPNKLSFERL